MALASELSTRLDVSTLLEAFTGSSTSLQQELDSVSAPATEDQFAGVTGIGSSVDLSGAAPAIGEVTGQLGGLLASFPSASEALGPLTSILETLETLANANVEQSLKDLADRLAADFGGDGRANFLDALDRFGAALDGASELGALKDLLTSLLQAGGVNLAPGSISLPNIPTAVSSGVKVLGGMMCLESVLSEAARLGETMASLLDRKELDRRVENAAAAFSRPGFNIAGVIASTNVADPGSVTVTRQALDTCGRNLDALLTYCEQSMGFGEATLLYLNPERLEVEASLAARIVHDTDSAPFENALRDVAARLAPLLQIDLSGVPARSLDQVLDLAEDRVASLAAGISSFDTTTLSQPVTDVVSLVTSLPNRLTDAINGVSLTVQGALNQIRDAIAALPFGAIAGALQQALEPIADALESLSALIQAIETALGQAVSTLQDILNRTESAIDDLKQGIQSAFGAAADFIHGLNLDQVIGQIGASVQAFADLIAQAQMKPYFDTAVDAINTAAGVVEKVPFSILPDSMEQEVVDVLRPIKQTDAGAIESEIENILQIGPDGKFQLRPEIEQAIKTVQDKYDDLIATLENFDPQDLLEDLDAEMKALADRIRAISPSVELQPVQDALDQLRAAVASINLDEALQPLRDAFDAVLGAVDQYSPGELIAPIEQRIDEVRESLVNTIRIREWSAQLDEIETQAAALLDRFDPTNLESQIAEGLEEARRVLDQAPQVHIGGFLGGIVSAMLSGSGLRANPLAFEVVLGWLSGVSGAAALNAYTRRFADGISSARTVVSGVDLRGISSRLTPLMSSARSAAQSLPAGEVRDMLLTAINRTDPAERLARLVANHERYAGLLTSAESLAQRVSLIGFSQVDVASGRIRNALSALASFRDLLDDFLGRIGTNGLRLSVGDLFRRLLEVAPPERLAAIGTPIFLAFRNKILDLINSILSPIRAGISDLIALIDSIDITPLRESLDEIHQAVRQQVEALHPDNILGEVLIAFRDAQNEVAAFDPLADITEALEALRDSVARLLAKMNVSELLAEPIALYDEIVGTLATLNVQQLMAPVLDQIDAIAAQVDEGLDNTVAAFQRLQDALPDQVGSTSLTVSASAGAG